MKDIGAILQWIRQDSRFDGQRLGVIGGSYGGLRVRGRSAMLVRGQLRRLDDHLARLVDEGRIEKTAAIAVAQDPPALQQRLGP